MPCFDVAHVREQDTNMIVVIVGGPFGAKSKAEQSHIVEALQVCANRAGLAGTVVPVWEKDGGQMGFVAPPDWQRYFSNLRYADIARNVNRKLHCSPDGHASAENIQDRRPVVV
ncbi:MAG TPA: hypothetical protein VFW40_12425 [Capsulimonadaceae bacterium]|nr:hypothetical protein [Capsulimonadaceae bacterium]